MEKIIRYFAENKLVVNLLGVIIIVVGIYSAFNLKQDVFPPTDIDTMIVTVIYPGASPADVELNAVVPIENKIRNIQGIKDFVSLSIENGATIYIYLDQDTPDKQKVKDEVYRNLNNVPDLAPEVEDIIIHDANPKLMSVYTFGVSRKEGTDLEERDLYQFVDSIEEQLLRVKGVAEIRKAGYLDREIKVLISPKKMESYYISLNDIVKSIQKNKDVADYLNTDLLEFNEWIITYGIRHVRCSRSVKLNNVQKQSFWQYLGCMNLQEIKEFAKIVYGLDVDIEGYLMDLKLREKSSPVRLGILLYFAQDFGDLNKIDKRQVVKIVNNLGWYKPKKRSVNDRKLLDL